MKPGRCALVCLLAALAAASLGGCATGAKPEAMVADKVAISHSSSSDVTVVVSGGKETSKLGASQVSDAAFAQALRDSITKSGLFKSVADTGGRYELSAFIGKVDQPMIGFSLTVKMEVSYTLIDTSSGKTVWSKNIASEHTAKTGEAFAAVERLRLANQGAAKANIEQAISEMSQVDL
jgi:ATP phosphoribosyltransferase regulatory subunit HisZ